MAKPRKTRIDASSHEAAAIRLQASIDQMIAFERTVLIRQPKDHIAEMDRMLIRGDAAALRNLPGASLLQVCRLAVIGMHYVQVSALETLQAIKEEASTDSAD